VSSVAKEVAAMSEDEKRAIQMAALLEFEEAKTTLALLRAKADQWKHLQDKAAGLLLAMKRDSAHSISRADGLRAEIACNLAPYVAATKIEAILALDSELEAAIDRLEKAVTAKRSLGFE
jgi:hypothetical protein